MDMAVDAAGQDEAARRVDLFRRCAEGFAERDDLAAADADIAVHTVRRRHHRAVADDEIERGHVSDHPLRLGAIVPRS